MDKVVEHHFEYYNVNGHLLGRSNGEKPLSNLYTKAHYVIKNDEDMIKNADGSEIIEQDIIRLRKKLLSIPLSNMPMIVRLNQIIHNLEKFVV